jgi:hypothetical protein
MTFLCQKLEVRIVLDSPEVVSTINTLEFGVSSHAAINSWQLKIAEKTELGSHTTKMKQTRQQIRETLAANAHYAQMETL